MSDLVLIPTFDRPEMLWLCLEALARCPTGDPLAIRIYVDAHIGQPPPPKDEIVRVVERFPQLSVQIAYRASHPYPGNSYNVLMAYKDAYESDAPHVFLVEDDVIVFPPFFTWHRVMHLTQSLGCSIAIENPGHGAYASLGVCFKRETLGLVVPHCRTAYFQDMRGYCRAHFPPSKFDCEQDGLFARVLKGFPVAWALIPVAQHVGWYGYHRPKSIRPHGTLEERYVQVTKTLSNAQALRRVTREFKDIFPLPKECN
jgi:hypothetical protein